MRYKVVPEPRGVEFLYSVRDALPLVPGSVEDCCTRIRDRTDLASRDAAREWLTFLQALGLAAETDRGYHRVRDDPGRKEIAAAFRRRVFGAREVLDALSGADGIGVEAAFEAVRDDVPRWERSRHADWEHEWREHVRRLLEWGVAIDLVERTGDGYRITEE